MKNVNHKISLVIQKYTISNFGPMITEIDNNVNNDIVTKVESKICDEIDNDVWFGICNEMEINVRI